MCVELIKNEKGHCLEYRLGVLFTVIKNINKC